MAAYCTLDDLKKKVPEKVLIALTDDEGLGVVDQQRVDEAISAASDEIDLYIGKVAKLPLEQDQVPPVLRSLCADMAVYHLYSRLKEEVPATRSDRYRNALRLLEKILKGEVSIGLEPPPEAPPNRDVLVSSREQIFDEETMGKF